MICHNQARLLMQLMAPFFHLFINSKLRRAFKSRWAETKSSSKEDAPKLFQKNTSQEPRRVVTIHPLVCRKSKHSTVLEVQRRQMLLLVQYPAIAGLKEN